MARGGGREGSRFQSITIDSWMKLWRSELIKNTPVIWVYLIGLGVPWRQSVSLIRRGFPKGRDSLSFDTGDSWV